MKHLLLASLVALAPVSALAAAYQMTSGSSVIRESDGATIPDAPTNPDWQRYQAWLKAGNIPDAAPGLGAADTANAQLDAALSAGLQIVSTSTPSLDGTYLLDSQNQSDATSVALYIQTFNAFPDGLSTFPWPDKSGKIHQIPTTTIGLSFFRAIADYTAALDIAYNEAIAGQTPTWPTQPVTIP